MHFCVLCCYTMQVVILICTVYCKKKVDVRVRQREKCISPDMLAQSSGLFTDSTWKREKKNAAL